MIDAEDYEDSTIRRHRQIILDYLGFREFDQKAVESAQRQIEPMVRSQTRGKFILGRLVDYLVAKKVEVPSVRTLADLILDEADRHQATLSTAIETNLSREDKSFLDELFEKDADTSQNNPQLQRFKLTLLKRISQSIRPGKIRGTVQDLLLLRSHYARLQPTVRALDITSVGVRYYATSVIKSQVFQVSRRAEEDRYLHLVCFIAHQYYRIQDTLVDILLTSVQSNLTSCDREYKDKCYDERAEQRQSVRTLVKSVDVGACDPLDRIEAIAFQPDISDQEKVASIQEVLNGGRDQRQTARKTLEDFKEQYEQSGEDAEYYDVVESRSVKLQNKAADIVRHLSFESPIDTELMQAVRHYQNKAGMVSASSPREFLEPHQADALTSETGKFRVSLYKAVLFVHLANAIRSGEVNLKDSYKYRSLDDYLIPKDDWVQNRAEYLEQADLESVAQCADTLQVLDERLTEQYRRANEDVIQDENRFLKIHDNGTFHVTTPKKQQEYSELLLSVFPEKRYISLLEVVSTVNRITGFLDQFQHW